MVIMAVVSLGIGLFPAHAASVADRAIAAQLAGGPAHVMHRTAAGEDLELVVAFGGPGKPFSGGFWWSRNVKLGIFLQQVGDPGRVYKIAIEDGREFEECLARVERATASDLLLSCQPEKGAPVANRHYVFEARSKSLVKSVAYGRYPMERATATPGGAKLVGRGVEIDYEAGSFRARRRADAVPGRVGSTRFGAFRMSTPEGGNPEVWEGTKRYRLPQSSYDAFAAARPARVADGYVRGGTQINEYIGPWQLAEGTVWFGRSFYDGEGQSGVGGLGYFDVERRAFRVLTPEAVRPYGATAILVEPDAVWLGLAIHGEWASTGAGLMRYDRKTEQAAVFRLGELIGGIVRVGEQMVMATEFGVAVLENGVMRRYVVDERLRVLEAVRGPGYR